MPKETKPSDAVPAQPAPGAPLPINLPHPVSTVLPHSCRLLGRRLMFELDAFSEQGGEVWRFGPWLQKRIDAGLSPRGPVEDAIRLETAMFDVQTTGRRQIVLLRYEPDELLDPDIPAEELQPVASGVAVQIDAMDDELSIRWLDAKTA